MAPPTTEQKQRENEGMGEEGEGEEEVEREGEGEERGGSSIRPFMKNHSNSALLDVEPPVSLTLAYNGDVMIVIP